MNEALYDEYAGRLHAYCWSMVGQDAPFAMRDAFVAAARRGGPRHPASSRQTELWLYGLARTACLPRTATARMPMAGPLARAAAALRPDQREVLYLSGSRRLSPADVSGLVGLAPDTVQQLIQASRTRLQRGVLDNLLHGPVGHEHERLVTAFEKGTLDTYYAASLPTVPEPRLRDAVLASCAAETTAPLRVVIAPPNAGSSPADPIDLASRRKRPTRIAAAAGVAVGVAAAAGLVTALVSASPNNGAAQTGSRHLAASRVPAALPPISLYPAGSPSSESPASAKTTQVNTPSAGTPPVALPPSATSQAATPPSATPGVQHQPPPPKYSPPPQPTQSTPPTPSASPTPSTTPPTPTPSASASPTSQPTPNPTPTSSTTH